MVAFAKEYVSTEAHRAKVGLPAESPARSQNRAECFFARQTCRAAHGAPAVRLNAGENSRCRYDACRGASLAQEEHLPEISDVEVSVKVGDPIADTSLSANGKTSILGFNPSIKDGVLTVEVELEVRIKASLVGTDAYDTVLMLEMDHVTDFKILAYNKYSDYLRSNFIGKSFTRASFSNSFARASRYYLGRATASQSFWDSAGYRPNTWHNWTPGSRPPSRPSSRSIARYRLRSYGAESL